METARQIKIMDLGSRSGADLDSLCQRPKMDLQAVFKVVEPILEEVRTKGDEAVKSFTKKFDGGDPGELTVDPKTISVELRPTLKEAFETAYRNIYKFHAAQQPDELIVDTMPGVRCMRIVRPIERVGLYVPGGTAVLPSTLLMLGIPAQIAGCRQIIVATPPRPDGSISPEIVYAANMIGADLILKAGGAQAVAAMGWGTESVPKVDKIFGPGNQYVTAAKMLLQCSDAGVAIDMPAGPSEVLVIADKEAKPAFVASDLLSQAEHGPDSQVVAVVLPGFDTNLLATEIERQLDDLPRSDIARKALAHSFILKAGTPEEAFEFSNRYAPEHLIVNLTDAERWIDHIIHAGSVFLGQWSPESAGDYASGTNHTLPTYRYARMYSGVSVDSFIRRITVQKLDKEGLLNLGPTVMTLADAEQLEAHKRAVQLRLESMDK